MSFLLHKHVKLFESFFFFQIFTAVQPCACLQPVFLPVRLITIDFSSVQIRELGVANISKHLPSQPRYPTENRPQRRDLRAVLLATTMLVFFTSHRIMNIRDLKHQDGRWRRRRRISVKAKARPTPRSARLSMISNTATATSRQFSKRRTLLLRLQRQLVAYDNFWWL